MKTALLAISFVLLGACSVNVPSPDIATSTKPTLPATPKAGSSSSSGSSGEVVTTTTEDNPESLPTTISLHAVLPSDTKALHLMEGGETQLASLLTLNGDTPTLSPTPPGPSTPNVAAIDVVATVVSPDPGNCQPSFNFTFDSSSLGVLVSGNDDVSDPSANCALWTDRVASEGITMTLTNVPWNNVAAGTTARATVTLTIQ